jgi:chromate transporter
MKPFLLYLLLLKATLTSFSGLASLPMIRADLVLRRHVLTDEQLNTAVIVSRSTPGPIGIYVVSVGYSVDGVAGALAGWAAVCTPALLVMPLIRLASRRTTHPRMRSATHAVVAASAGLLAAAVVPIARESLTEPWTLSVAIVCLLLMFRRVSPLWLVLGASATGFIIGIVRLR